MESKTLVVIISALFILVVLIIIILKYFGVGIPIVDTVIEWVSDVFGVSTWFTGNMSEWPEWAR